MKFQKNKHFNNHSASMIPGLLFFLILCFPVRFYRDWLFFRSFSILDPVLVAGALLLIFLAFVRGSLLVGDKGIFFILLLPFLFSVLSVLWSVNIIATIKSVVVYGSAVVAYLMTVELFRGIEIDKLHKILVGIALVLVSTAVLSYIPASPLSPENTYPHKVGDAASGFMTSYYARFSHPLLGLSNSFATILSLIIPLLMLGKRLDAVPKLTNIVIIVLAAGVLASGSRGVLLALIVVYGAVLSYRIITRFKVPKWVIWGPVFVLAGAALFFILNPEALQFLSDRLSVKNVSARFDAFMASIKVVSQGHFLGVGSGVALGDVSDISLRSSHNAYIQNILWFGLLPGALLSAVMLFFPFYIAIVPTASKLAHFAKINLALSVMILMMINMTQASWEGSVLRVMIYSLIGFGVVMLKSSDFAECTR